MTRGVTTTCLETYNNMTRGVTTTLCRGRITTCMEDGQQRR